MLKHYSQIKQQTALILQVEVVNMQQNILSKVTFLKKIYYRFLLFIISYRNQSKILISLSLECMIRWKYLGECQPENVSDYLELARYHEIVDDVIWRSKHRWADFLDELTEELEDEEFMRTRGERIVRILSVFTTIVVVWIICNGHISDIVQSMDGFTMIPPELPELD